MIRGYAGGTFDLFHYGHVDFLWRCKRNCDYLIVSLNTDEFAARYKRKPILTLDERIESVEGCRHVDQVIVNVDDEDSTTSILAVKASLIFHGDDWPVEGLMQQMGLTMEWLIEHGVGMRYTPYVKGISASDIIERCRQSPLF